MIMADVFTYLFLTLGFLATLVCYWLMFQALFSERVERAQVLLGERLGKAFWTGLAVAVPMLAVGAALASRPNGLLKLLGIGILLCTALLALFGSTGLARRIGDGLSGPRDDVSPGKRVLRGGSVLAVSFVLPLVGWFVVLPAALLAGVGAAVLTGRGRGPLPGPSPAEGGA